MSNPLIRRLVLACALVVGFSLVFSVSSGSHSVGAIQVGEPIALMAPPVIQAAAADEAALADIADEAGFSAWYNATSAIDLDDVRGVCRTEPEIVTDDYLICSVPVPDYYETADAHVYVNTNGLILAYYEPMYPVSKALDALDNSIDSTKLETVLTTVAQAAGVLGFTGANYYDFRYQYATEMVLIAEYESGDNEFCVEVPSSYTVFEASWSAYGPVYDCSFGLDGENLFPLGHWSDGASAWFGPITVSQFPLGVRHCARVNNWGAMAIVYWAP